VNKFLTPAGIVAVLKHYEDLVGMEYWYPAAKEQGAYSGPAPAAGANAT
jgi:hypothetical protein